MGFYLGPGFLRIVTKAVMLSSLRLQRHHIYSIFDRIRQLTGYRVSPKEHLQLGQTRGQEGAVKRYRGPERAIQEPTGWTEIRIPGSRAFGPRRKSGYWADSGSILQFPSFMTLGTVGKHVEWTPLVSAERRKYEFHGLLSPVWKK